ncbi:MAG: hypothetical protein FWD44_00045 [Oscillospiraceae bacterium]|nr:hypothetical protein [Oscillospiraceae bacterium]
MVGSNFQGFLSLLYQELNSHHREQASQNNQIISFYVVVMTFFVGFYQSIISLSEPIISTIFIVIFVLSIVIILMLIQLRVWQLRYAYGLSLVGSMFMSDINIDNLSSFYSFINNFEIEYKSIYSLFASLRMKMIWSCFIISLIPIVLYFLYIQNLHIMNPFLLWTLYLGVNITYVLFVIFTFRKKIRGTCNKDDIIWLINFQKSSIQTTTGNTIHKNKNEDV